LEQSPLDTLDPFLLTLSGIPGREGLGADAWPVRSQVEIQESEIGEENRDVGRPARRGGDAPGGGGRAGMERLDAIRSDTRRLHATEERRRLLRRHGDIPKPRAWDMNNVDRVCSVVRVFVAAGSAAHDGFVKVNNWAHGIWGVSGGEWGLNRWRPISTTPKSGTSPRLDCAFFLRLVNTRSLLAAITNEARL
jgi:hypothetical protein